MPCHRQGRGRNGGTEHPHPAAAGQRAADDLREHRPAMVPLGSQRFGSRHGRLPAMAVELSHARQELQALGRKKLAEEHIFFS